MQRRRRRRVQRPRDIFGVETARRIRNEGGERLLVLSTRSFVSGIINGCRNLKARKEGVAIG